MFYGIKEGKVFIISEEKTKVKVDKWIESDVVNGVYERLKNLCCGFLQRLGL